MPACGPFVRLYQILGKVYIVLRKMSILGLRRERLALFHEERCLIEISIENLPGENFFMFNKY